MSRRIVVLALMALVACERPSSHVYGSPPPQPKPTGTPASPTMPDLPLGTTGPGARLVAISDAATGAPIPLGSIADSIDVLTLVAFGPVAGLSRDGGRVELALRGSSMDTTLVLPLEAPAPIIVAHPFRIAGLKAGRYTAVVRLRMIHGQVIAESIPTYFEVIAR
jgi:hypothetical protein